MVTSTAIWLLIAVKGLCSLGNEANGQPSLPLRQNNKCGPVPQEWRQVASSDVSGSGDYVLEKLGASINSRTDEIYPRISDDNKLLYFTRQGHPQNSKISPSGMDLTQYGLADMMDPLQDQDIWVAEMDPATSQPLRVLHPEYPMNSTTPNTIHCILPGRNQCVVQNQIIDPLGNRADFSISTLTGSGGFKRPEPLVIMGYKPLPGWRKVHFYTNGRDGLLSINLGDGNGANDLYYTSLMTDGKWSVPQNLGNQINTPGMEMSPYLATDLRTLYFSSERDGSSDLYLSRRVGDSWTEWTTPEKLPSPINSNGVDRDPCIDPSGRYLYFSSNRDGNYDLYRVELAKQTKPATVCIIRLHTARADNRAPLGGRIAIRVQKADLSEQTPQEAGLKDIPSEVETNSATGLYEIRLPVGYVYTFSASRPLHLSASGLMNLSQQRDFATFDLTLPLTPVSKGTMTRFSSILFKAATADLLPSSNAELERLATTMLEDPTIRIEVQGHTDNLGTTAELNALSQKRANTIKAGLVQKGVKADRIVAKGFGATRPAFDNKDPKEREKNRRVEIVLL